MGDSEWADQIRAHGITAADHPSAAVSYAELSSAVTHAVAALADAGRWELAAVHGDRAARYFMARRHELHPVAGASFDGLRAAAHERDRAGMADFIELLDELFPAGREE